MTCEVCNQEKQVEWCSLCKAYVCSDCQPKLVDRAIAAAKKGAATLARRVGTIR